MKRIANRIDKLESMMNPRGKKRRSDEEEEKEFFKGIESMKSILGVTDEWLKIPLALFKIEKEQAKKEKRPIETWWNVFWLAAYDKMTFEEREKKKRQYGVRPLTPEHRARVKELLARYGCSLAETM